MMVVATTYKGRWLLHLRILGCTRLPRLRMNESLWDLFAMTNFRPMNPPTLNLTTDTSPPGTSSYCHTIPANSCRHLHTMWHRKVLGYVVRHRHRLLASRQCGHLFPVVRPLSGANPCLCIYLSIFLCPLRHRPCPQACLYPCLYLFGIAIP